MVFLFKEVSIIILYRIAKRGEEDIDKKGDRCKEEEAKPTNQKN